MLSHDIITVRRNDGSKRNTKALRIFNTASGVTLWTCRSLPFEDSDAWVARAYATMPAA